MTSLVFLLVDLLSCVIIKFIFPVSIPNSSAIYEGKVTEARTSRVSNKPQFSSSTAQTCQGLWEQKTELAEIHG